MLERPLSHYWTSPLNNAFKLLLQASFTWRCDCSIRNKALFSFWEKPAYIDPGANGSTGIHVSLVNASTSLSRYSVDRANSSSMWMKGALMASSSDGMCCWQICSQEIGHAKKNINDQLFWCYLDQRKIYCQLGYKNVSLLKKFSKCCQCALFQFISFHLLISATFSNSQFQQKTQ